MGGWGGRKFIGILRARKTRSGWQRKTNNRRFLRLRSGQALRFRLAQRTRQTSLRI